MSQDLSVIKKAGLLQVGNNVSLGADGSVKNGDNFITVGPSSVSFKHSNSTQETSTTTGITVSGSSGIITTFASTLAAVSSETFTVSNSSVMADSVVVVSTVNYSGTYGTDGIPVVSVSSVVQGGFDVIVTNAHATAPLDGNLMISFIIV